jgi:hypothetical protein
MKHMYNSRNNKKSKKRQNIGLIEDRQRTGSMKNLTSGQRRGEKVRGDPPSSYLSISYTRGNFL